MIRRVFFISALTCLLSVVGWSQNGITYHNAPNAPILSDPNVYLIWYGNWAGNSATSILPDLLTGLSGSRYFGTNSTYYENNPQTGQTIVNHLTLAGQVFIGYPFGRFLSDPSMGSIVNRVLQLNQLPVDANGIYFVLTSPDVVFDNQACTLCGFHNHGAFNLTDVKFAYVGDPATQCQNPCAINNSPNGNVGADSMASWIAHELNETVTDPDLNAWYGLNLMQEVGDKCVFTLLNNPANFGPTNVDAQGQLYNVTLGARNFLIQQNWVNFRGGFCGLGVGAPPPLNSAFVEQQYFDFLDRAAEPSGLAGWVNNLNNGTSRSAFIQAILQGEEIAARGKFVEQCYVGLLQRPSDFGGFRNWLSAILNGASEEDTVGGFIASGEFHTKTGLPLNPTAVQFVTALYSQILHRQPQGTEDSAWINALNSGSLTPAQVALDILQSNEFVSNQDRQNEMNVGLLYVDMLRRTPDTNGFNSWVSQLHSGVPLTSVINGFINSAEYAARF